MSTEKMSILLEGMKVIEADKTKPIDISMPDISDFDEKFGISQDDEDDEDIFGDDDYDSGLDDDPWDIDEDEDTDFGVEPDYDEEDNHTLSPADDWLDSPKASEIGLSKDFPDHGWEDEDDFDRDGARIHEEDPWGIGEGEGDALVPDDIQISQGEDDFVPDDIQLNEIDARPVTTQLMTAVADEMLDLGEIFERTLEWMSEADVAEMVEHHGWLDDIFTDE